MTADDAKKIEGDSRRNLADPGVVHPDSCEKLRLHGADFGVQPLAPPKGVRFRPRFGEGSVELSIHIAEDPPTDGDGELVELAQLIRSDAPITETDICPECDQPKGGELEIDLDSHQEFLCKLVDYAARLLRKQYLLSDEQLGELLAFDGESLPEWMGQVIRHALALSTRGKVEPPNPSSEGWADVCGDATPPSPETESVEAPSPPLRKRRWPWSR